MWNSNRIYGLVSVEYTSEVGRHVFINCFVPIMHSAESHCGKGIVYKGIRRHAKKRMGRVMYRHCNYFLKLEEGKPPKDYYNKEVSPDQLLDKWLDKMHSRKID